MTDNVAVLEGFTKYVQGIADGENDLYLLVKPATDLDTCFKAYDTDMQEWIKVNGWLYSFEILEQE